VNGSDNLVLVSPYLARRVTVAQCDCTVLERLEINSDAQRGAELVVSAVALADGGRRVVYAAGDAGGPEFLREFADLRGEVLVRRERDDEDLSRCDGRGEGENLEYVRINSKNKG
jgi:hypothetical protein